MKRREFIALVGGAAVAWPLASRGQQAMPVVGFLHTASPEPVIDRVAAFRKALSETGFVEGQNVMIEYRWAQGRIDRLPALANELVHRPVDLIGAFGGIPSAL